MSDKTYKRDETYGIASDKTFEDREEAAIAKSQRERREQDAKEKTLGSIFKKKEKEEEENSGGWLTEKLPYDISPSYIQHNGRFSAMVELYNRPGSNRQMSFSDVIDLIPVDSLDSVEMHVIIKDASIKGDEKKRLIRKNAKGGKEVIKDAQKNGPKEDAENKSTQAAAISDTEDYDDYEMILDAAEPVVLFTIQLVVIGPDAATVEEQIEILNTLLDQRHEGAQWGSLGGDQAHRLASVFRPITANRFQMTSTGSNYAGLNFSVNAGLNDNKGLPLGSDALSLTQSTAYFDMNGTLFKQAVIAMPRSARMLRYTRTDENGEATSTDNPSTASITAQYAANQAVLEGNRVHHIVLNNFNYFESGLYYRKPDVPGMFDFYDVSKVTINPLQGFGDIEDVVNIYSRLTNKIVNIFNVLNNLSMSDADRAMILDATDRFYLNNRLWIPDAEKFPKRTRIVNIPNPDSYPNLGQYINEFTNLAREAMNDNREHRADTIETLQSILSQVLTAYRGVFGRPTSIQQSNARQVYYSFANIEEARVKQAQFLNLLEYVIWTADKDDIIIIHGADQLWSQVLKMAHETIAAAEDKGYRFIFAFDAISNQTGSDIKKADFFDMQGTYYKDYDTGVDWSVTGRCLPDEVDAFETVMASALSPTIRHMMQSKSTSQALVHRAMGDVNNFVHLNVVI